MKLLPAIAGDSDAENPIQAEFVPPADGTAEPEAPKRKLNLDRSKHYAKEILAGMDAKQALEFLRDQVLTKNLLINEAIIGQLEAMEAAQTWGEKCLIAQNIQVLTATSTEITQSKLALDKALGMNLVPHLPETAATPNPETNKKREISPEEFSKAYQDAATRTGTAPADKLSNA